MIRIGKVDILGRLDELERLMREYIAWVSEGVGEDAGLTRQLALSSFLEWLRQRQRQSVVGGSNVERNKTRQRRGELNEQR